MTIPNGFRPMLAATCTDTSKIKYPVLGSVKLDGIRAVIFGGVAYSRSLKPIRNTYIQAWAAYYADRLEGLDGEFIVGSPNATDVFQVTTSGVMSEDGEPNFTFYAFDFVNERPFRERIFNAYMKKVPRLLIVNQFEISNEEELLEHEARFLSDGYEGLMVKDPNGLYKFGRSTEKSGQLLKVKRFSHDEAEIIDIQPLYVNNNDSVENQLGYKQKSTNKENLIATEMLGSFTCKTSEGVEFSVGSGLTEEQRVEFWTRRNLLIGKMLRYKHFPIGAVYGVPRFPIFQGFRDKDDL